jgi:putative protein-disulfide isomerase
MRRFRADGVPAVIAGVGGSRSLVPGNALFGSHEVLVARLKGLSLATA